MFAALDTREWGAADVALSVAMGTRSVWFYGDTFTSIKGKFNHSTAVTQTGGCLHVSRGGAQVLPDTDATHIYWITGAKRLNASELTVTADQVWVSGTSAWSFQTVGTRSAVVSLNAAGDLTFRRWLPTTVTIAASPVVKDNGILGSTVSWTGRVVISGVGSHDHRFTYAAALHPELKLANGTVLVTLCQNDDDGMLHSFAYYQPLYFAVRH